MDYQIWVYVYKRVINYITSSCICIPVGALLALHHAVLRTEYRFKFVQPLGQKYQSLLLLNLSIFFFFSFFG